MGLVLLILFQTEEYEPASLTWLARHQRPDGFWSAPSVHEQCGRRFLGLCGDAPLVPAWPYFDALDACFIELALKLCDNDEYAIREKGSRLLLAYGFRSEAYLRDRLSTLSEPEVRSRIQQALSDMPRHASGHGSVAATALALLAFLNSGYTHLSKDTYADICFGTVVKKAIQVFMRLQQDNRFIGNPKDRRAAFAHILASYALSEAYGLTSSALIRDSAQGAVDALLRLQNEDGGWPAEAQGASDPLATYFASCALKSAELAELTFDKASIEKLGTWIGAQKKNLQERDTITLAAVSTHSVFWLKTKEVDASSILLGRMEKADWDSFEWYAASMVAFLFDGPQGPEWKKFNEKLKARLNIQENLKGSCRRGGWTPRNRRDQERGMVGTTALSYMCFCFYYR